MIFVDSLRPRRAMWRGSVTCQLISDTSRTELLDFALGIGLVPHWFRPTPFPCFEIAPSQRARAIAAGARPAAGPEFTAAMRRFRTAEREERRRYRDWLEAGPERGPYPTRQP